MQLRRIWRDYSLGIILAALFLTSWVAQAIVGWVEFTSEQATHNEPSTVFGASGYVWVFLQSTLENWQSEFLQLLTFVVLTTYFIYRQSHESRDGQDEMKATIDRIERQVSKLTAANGDEVGRRRAKA
jgi:hypothetical protein